MGLRKLYKGLIIAGSILLVLGATYGTIALLPRKHNIEFTNPLLKDDPVLPLLIAHGGGNKEFPDNTLEAFMNAYQVDNNVMMETDVSITKDNVVILSHDISLDRKTNVTGLISDWNYQDLINQKVDFGYTNPVRKNEEGYNELNGERIKFKDDNNQELLPKDLVLEAGNELKNRDENVYLATTLEDLLTTFPNNRINVEIKQSGELGKKCFSTVLDLVKKYDAFDRVVLASFHDEIFNEFKKFQENEGKDLNFMYSPSTGGVVKFYLLHATKLDALYNDKITVLQLPLEQMGITLATESLIETAHKHNIATHYWTINDKETMVKLIELGADGIMSDYPHRLKEVYDEYINKGV